MVPGTGPPLRRLPAIEPAQGAVGQLAVGGSPSQAPGLSLDCGWPGMAERQTHPTQNRARATSWEFESPSRDQAGLAPAAASPEPLVAFVEHGPGGSWRRLTGGLWGYVNGPDLALDPANVVLACVPVTTGGDRRARRHSDPGPRVPHRALRSARGMGGAPGVRGLSGALVHHAEWH